MEWDKFTAAQKFLQKAHAIHPEDYEQHHARDTALARQDVYYDCYMSSFSKESLLSRLEEVIGGKIELPEEEDVDADTYRTVYIREATIILTALRAGNYP